MTQPAVTITELDGALGVLPPTAGRLVAFVGPATSGPLDTPATFARVQDLVASFGGGQTVEAAAFYINITGKPLVFVRTGNTVAASVSAVVKTGTGLSVGTIAASPTPPDDYEYKVKFLIGTATVGVTGATYQLSRDGGRTYDPVAQLGIATSITLDTGVTLNLSAASIVAGDTYSAVAKAAQWNAAELTSSLTALGNSTINWEQLAVVGTLDSAAFDAIEVKVASWHAQGKERNWFASPRIPAIGESEAAYLTAMAGIFGSKVTKHGGVAYAAAKITSGVSGRKYRRPTVFTVVPAHGLVSEEIDVADINIGALAGVSIRDANGNPDEHDESINPGGDDARFITLRTWDGYPGVYVNRPLIMSAPGSDFQLVPHRRVMNLAEIALRSYFIRRLNRPVRVDVATGFILEVDAVEIENGALQTLRSTLMAKPKASGVQFALSRTDNILSTKTLTGSARVIPLAYPEFINLTVGFYNPALTVLAA